MMNAIVEMTSSYLIPPGEYIQDWLNDCGMSAVEFCKRMEISKPTYYRILNGTQPITTDTARRLELVTGACAEFWNKLETDYRHQLLCQEAEQRAKEQKEWIKEQPIADLIAADFLPVDFWKKSVGEQLATLCSFYGVSSVSAYDQIHTPYAFAARTVKGVVSNSKALTAWLQMAARVALEHIPHLRPYDINKFKTSLDLIRYKTQEIDSRELTFVNFLLQAREELAKSGVEVIYLKKVKNVKNLNGVVFWMKEHPVIVLTLHSGAFDRILFSLYHEAAHILNDDPKFIYVTDREDSEIEKRADRYAAEMLIPKKFDASICSSNGKIYTLQRIAQDLKISVAVVVGRYQKLRNHYFPIDGYVNPKINWAEIGGWRLI